MARYNKTAFRGKALVIDGNEYLGCKFENCTIVFCGAAPVVLDACTFEACQWSFDGPAARTAQFMAALYQMGGSAQMLIQRTLQIPASAQTPVAGADAPIVRTADQAN